MEGSRTTRVVAGVLFEVSRDVGLPLLGCLGFRLSFEAFPSLLRCSSPGVRCKQSALGVEESKI